eukprot:maker-scaffold345_size201316-snap-gene-0.9 protein:Tk12163 transcript:maker-scaffold345_size201316-snap-gene-0.9-mRNA-1 annotation:"multidrug resistance protein b"
MNLTSVITRITLSRPIVMISILDHLFCDLMRATNVSLIYYIFCYSWISHSLLAGLDLLVAQTSQFAMKTFIYSVAIALLAFAALTLAFPQDEDMATEEANLDEAYESGLLDSFTFTHVELMEEDSDLEDRAEDADNRLNRQRWCQRKCSGQCAGNPNSTCVCRKTFMGVFTLFTMNIRCS